MAGKSKRGALRGLSLKGQKWWVKIAIPAACRHHFGGRTTYLENLNTSDIRVAKERRDQVERDIRELFQMIKAGKVVSEAVLSARDRGALWLEAVKGADPDERDFIVGLAEDEAERLRDRDRIEFTDTFTGRVPVEEHLEAYLSAIRLADKTTNERRGLVKRFGRWCAGEGLKLPDIDRKTVGRYVTAVIEPMDRRTAKKHMTALRGYWEYLIKRGHVEGPAERSPWLGQEIASGKRRVERGDRDQQERPFTEEEAKALLYGDWPKGHGPGEGMDPAHREQIEDALRISLLSGMRMAEVLTLWVEEVHDDLFDIKQGKTQAAARKVPIHPDLKEIVKRRTEGKGPKEWLFHELAQERDPGDTFGKRFNRYRKHLKVDDVRPGKRRSLVNFHSARRWFVTQARHAGQPLETIKDVVGHSQDKKEITFGVYTQGASEKQMRDCVEAVKLPPVTGKTLY